MLKKILLVVGLIILILLSGSIAYIFYSVPDLPPNTDAIIDQVLNSELPELITGDTGYAYNGDIKIWYESILPEGPPKATILLMMGIANDSMAWPVMFLNEFVKAGYQVIRYDYRGTGMSDWIEDWEGNGAYTLTDMVNDAVTILDDLDIDKANIIGLSMGGMVAQLFAIEQPQRTLSLTSIMSTGNAMDPDLPSINSSIFFQFFIAALRYTIFSSEQNIIRLAITGNIILRGNANYEIDVKSIAENTLYNLRNRNGLNWDASSQHSNAVMASGSRYEQLPDINLPTLIIHGLNDPLMPIEHSYKLAELIPNAQTFWVEGLAHGLPNSHIETIVHKITDFYNNIQ